MNDEIKVKAACVRPCRRRRYCLQQGRELLVAIGNGEVADAEQAVNDWNAAKPAPPFPEAEEP